MPAKPFITNESGAAMPVLAFNPRTHITNHVTTADGSTLLNKGEGQIIKAVGGAINIGFGSDPNTPPDVFYPLADGERLDGGVNLDESDGPTYLFWNGGSASVTIRIIRSS